MTRRGWLLFGALGLAWGIPYLFIRIAVVDLDPLLVAVGRTLIGALLLLPLTLRRNALRPVLARWRWLVAYTVVEIVVPWLMIGHAETRLNSSTTGLLISMVPIAAAVIVTVTGQDRLGPRRVLGLLIGLVGVALVVGLDLDLGDRVAVLQLLVVVVGYATGPIIIARKLGDLPPIGVVTASLLVATVVYAPFAPLVWPTRAVSGAAILSVVVLAAVCTAVAFLLMFALVAEAGPARMTLITYVNPVVAIGLGALVLDEPLTAGLAIGFPLIITGSILGTSANRTPPAEAPVTAEVSASSDPTPERAAD